MGNFIPVNEPIFAGREKELLLECIKTGWISSEGPFVGEFEKSFAKRVQRKYGVAVSNGSAALQVAVEALDIGNGDEVILPSFTIISCASPVVRCGGIPVLVDSDHATWNMNVSQVESKITDKTRAIMVVHIYGMPVDMDPILDIAGKYNLKVIEDAAEAIGQTYKGKPCGTFGDISTFSFYPNKHITTGEGGMIVTNDAALADRCRSLRNLSLGLGNERFVHRELGWNFRMTNLQAAMGLAQLERLDANITRKREIGKHYQAVLSSVSSVELPLTQNAYAENLYWVFGLVIRDEIPFAAKEAIQKLSDEQIGSRPFFWPMHEQPVFQRLGLFNNEKHPVAERLARRGFYIPSGLSLTDEQIENVAKIIKRIFS